ncbi:MAG: UDP-4-amino-4,6-dideoxy-N-acetyl-beta-L-altrosamine transaminase [Negativicutes bacterium]|nr:UDP-4-amino-4,6-dideoxy-N-acetyl-beta-L-altrosamine transaminase [Negativicutes bacterium]
MNRIIPYGRHLVDSEDIAAVTEVLASDYLTQGPAVERFEQAVSQRVGAKYAVATCNATAALHLAGRALDLGPGDLVWVAANSFVASANFAFYCGATVDFVDIDPHTYNISVGCLAEKLREQRLAGRPLPRAVVAVHFAGQPADMAKIAALAEEYDFAVIEDAAHAIGATYDQQPVGNCRYSLMTVFSFHPVKIITTGEGGMITTNDHKLSDRLRRLRSHGVERRHNFNSNSARAWYYEQVELGYNYRMTDFQAALGLSQLARLDEFISERSCLAGRYFRELQDAPLVLPWVSPRVRSAWHLYVVQLAGHLPAECRDSVIDQLRARGIMAAVHYMPIYLHPFYRQMGFAPGCCPAAESYYQRAVTLPLFCQMTEQQQLSVVGNLNEVLDRLEK